jgi:hypothetical protein
MIKYSNNSYNIIGGNYERTNYKYGNPDTNYKTIQMSELLLEAQS